MDIISEEQYEFLKQKKREQSKTEQEMTEAIQKKEEFKKTFLKDLFFEFTKTEFTDELYEKYLVALKKNKSYNLFKFIEAQGIEVIGLEEQDINKD
jgi:uncharacterized protein YllA (UPF0747 family)